MSKRVYISGAITGTTDYMERFEKAENYLKSKGYSVVNPAKVNAQMPEDTTYEEYMKMSFCLLSLCDVAYFLNGWRNSNGANKEYRYALEHSIKAIFEWSEITGIKDSTIRNRLNRGWDIDKALSVKSRKYIKKK